MAEYQIPYHLPLSAIRFSGTKTVTTDRLQESQPPTTKWQSTAGLVTVADATTHCATVKAGWLLNSNVSLAFTEDGRLTSVDATSTGSASTLVKGVVTAGVALAASVLSPASGVAAATIDVLRGVEAGEPLPEEAPDPIAAYAAEHPTEAALRAALIASVTEAELALSGALQVVIAEPTNDNLKRYENQQKALGLARADLARVQQHFMAWRQSKITTREQTHEQTVTLDELRTAGVGFDGKTITWHAEPPSWARVLWDRCGLMAVVESDPPAEQPRTVSRPQRGVSARRPRSAAIAIYRRITEADNWEAELVSVDDHLVVDASSRSNLYRFRTSIWSKRKVTLTMSESGLLTGYAHETTASAEKIGETLGALPDSVEQALTKASGIRDKLTELENKARAEAKADLDAAIEEKKQQIVMAGLLATEADQVELERLTQQKALLDQQALVGRAPLAAELETTKKELELAQKQRDLATERELAELKMEIARLEAEVDRLAAGGAE